VNEQGTINSLSDYSIMIDAISDKLEHAAFLSIDKPISEDKEVLQLIKSLVTSPRTSVAL
jgi:hypothetical protein